MRSLIYILFIGSLLHFFSCRPEVEPLFTMDLQADFDIPAGLSGILTHTFIIRDYDNPLDGYSSTFGVDTSRIKAIQAGRGELVPIFGGASYDFVEKVSVWMVDSENPNLRREIFYLDFNNNQNNSGLRLLSSTSNVKDMMTKETFDLEIKLTLRRISPQLIENRLIFSLLALE